MNIIIYILIFVSKVVENALGTVRLIVVAHGKKWLGAVLQFLIALVWIMATGFVVIDIMKDPFKIIIFALGSFVGSYVGSYIEEKMAIGDNMLVAIVDIELGEEIANRIRNEGIVVTSLTGEDMDKKRSVLMIMVSRKKRHHVVDVINSVDNNALIVSENARSLADKYDYDDKK